MNTSIRTSIVCLAVISVAVAATPRNSQRLTAQRITELTAPTDTPLPKGYKVEISAFGATTLPAAKPEGEIQDIREFRFPTEFDLPQVAANGGVIPITPAAFEQVNTGWTVHLTIQARGKLIQVNGIADYITVELVPGGYGALAGPIYDEKGGLLSPNKLDQPRFQTTTTRFRIFALPGQPYEVTLYRGDKPEKHLVTVSAE